MKQVRLFLLAALVLTMGSCVSKKKLTAANEEIAKLQSENGNLNNQVKDLNGQVSNLQSQNSSLNSDIQKCKDAYATIQKKQQQLEGALAAQGKSMEEIRHQVAEAMNKFSKEDIEVTYKNGLVYISMQDKLLFQTGSAKLGKAGIEALGTVAAVLNEHPDIKVTVVGHTDSIAIKKAYQDNWSLSTERANSIVRILRDNYSVDPGRLTSAGKSKYQPVDDNATPEGRSRNRRTEIILNPDLSKLWELAEQTN
ncbi:OmpA family protein [Flavihumibacter rivuli]|uniref:OmpA family protein n=1 Tax=Flavihumibacter rivuli TaxID=2838156 RepID=UPI001BDE9627|nr:OmpA family protein [Flavihumibacter rivuli]ULQ57057.1 OmpA family protein [Flavihumibacter rivuli]